MDKIPKHVGIIIDGNRRFAKKLLLKSWQGHKLGLKKLRDFIDWCFELGIKEVTVYALSIQNLSRTKQEVYFLLKLLKKESQTLLNQTNDLKQKGIKINFIGKSSLLPKDIVSLQKKVINETKNNIDKKINFAVAYGGREEILDAVNKIIKNKKIKNVNEEIFSKYLYLNSNPDLIIRTGTEIRTSNFLPWQSTYSEYIFLKKLWPEIEKQDLIDCIKEYQTRERRFGK